MLLSYRGETHTLSEWAERTGLGYTTLVMRVTHLGWSPRQALTTPAGVTKRNPAVQRPYRRMLHFRRRTTNVSAWARTQGMKRTALVMRLKAGWSVDQALTVPRYSRRNRQAAGAAALPAAA